MFKQAAVLSCPSFLQRKNGSLIELILLYMYGQKGIAIFASVKLILIVLKDVKEQKRKKVKGGSCSQVKKHSSVYFTVAVKSIEDISVQPVREQELEEYVVTDLDLRNEKKNRFSFTSCAVEEERQVV